MNELAIFGGEPIRSDKIYYGKQWIDNEDIKAVADTLSAPLITQGPKVEELENKLCGFTGAKYAVCLSNGTAALHIACLAAGIKSGDEVITTPLTFAASSNCVLYCGANPVFADVDPHTYNISPESIIKCITPKTKAIIAVDFTGQVVEIEKIRSICDKYNLIFIEDAAHSIASKYNGKQVGSLADITTFSFHPVKTVTGGEGGAVLTNDKSIYERLKLFRTHGITRESAFLQSHNDDPWYYEQIELGFNYRITDFQAALILSQLKKIDMFALKRKQIAQYYNEAFKNTPEIILQEEIPQSDSCKHLYIIRLNFELLRCTRREFFDAMYCENVCPNVHYIPIYYLPYYRNLGYKKGICPNTEMLYEGFLSIPLYPAMSEKDINDTVNAVKKVVYYYRKDK